MFVSICFMYLAVLILATHMFTNGISLAYIDTFIDIYIYIYYPSLSSVIDFILKYTLLIWVLLHQPSFHSLNHLK